VHPDEEDSGANDVPGAPLEQSDKPRAGSKYGLVLEVAHDSWWPSLSCCGIPGQGLQTLRQYFATRYSP
jgi:hypothetical protein